MIEIDHPQHSHTACFALSELQAIGRAVFGDELKDAGGRPTLEWMNALAAAVEKQYPTPTRVGGDSDPFWASVKVIIVMAIATVRAGYSWVGAWAGVRDDSSRVHASTFAFAYYTMPNVCVGGGGAVCR